MTLHTLEAIACFVVFAVAVATLHVARLNYRLAQRLARQIAELTEIAELQRKIQETKGRP